MMVLAIHGEVAKKIFLRWGFPHTSLLCLLMLLLVLNFLPQSLQASTLQLCCQIVCWQGIFKDLKALSHTLQGWTLSLCWDLSPHTDPIQQQHDFPHKPTLDTCRSRCQQISTPLHVLLKADPRLEGDVADGKADPLVCLQLNQISVLQHFSETTGSMDHQMCLDRLFFKKFLPQWLHCSGKQGRVASGRLSGACWVFVYLYNVVV